MFKLNRADAIRPDAERKIDDHFAPLINAALGPFAGLYALKRIDATVGVTALIDGEDDRRAILQRSAEQDARIAELDSQRRAMKAAARAATTSKEIAAILEKLTHAR